uniref:CHCH domain-containing protein n=1 Tax=Ascaris lumbricoides TaxID=6252 RepID=A0A0M3IMG2_ASCLU
MAFKFTSNNDRHKVFTLSEDEFKEPIRDEYAKSLEELSPAELYDDYNPGPTLPDGGVNFECHCVSHLVASPCGYEFREAIKCQKAASEAELEEGACADELMNFMRCAIRTECFRSRSDDDEEMEKKAEKSSAEEASQIKSSEEANSAK